MEFNIKGKPTFNIELGTAYYNWGFIIPGVDVDKHFGPHGEKIKFYLGDEENSIEGRIDRKSNQNGSARIFGNKPLSDWIQNNFELGDIVKGIIIKKNKIFLR